MKNEYNKTITACFVGYIVQAIVNNFVPLLFLTFQRTWQIPLSQITMLVTFNFGIQLLVDLLSVSFVDRIGYRVSMIIAHILSALGLILLTILPEILPSAFAGILISVMIYAIGGGLLEVLVSPVVEACPSENKEKAMSMLHSFYCWGHVGGGIDFYDIFCNRRYSKLENAGDYLGGDSTGQCHCFYKGSDCSADGGGRDWLEPERTVWDQGFLDLTDHDDLSRSQ